MVKFILQCLKLILFLAFGIPMLLVLGFFVALKTLVHNKF